MNKIVILILLMLIGIVLPSYAQTFHITDIVFNEKMPEHRVQRIKNDRLGKTFQIKVFDNDIQMQPLDANGKPDGRPYIMQGQSNGTYISKRNETIVPSHPFIYTSIMSIEKVLGYYKTIKIELWENQNWLWTLTLKRK